MTWFYWLITAITVAFCGWKAYEIRMISNKELADADDINVALDKEITDARAIKRELERDISVLEKTLVESDIETLIQEIDKDRAARNESPCLKKIIKLFRSLQPDLDDLCGILLDAEKIKNPLSDATLLHCYALAALGSANGGANSARYRELLTHIEAECKQRTLSLPLLAPSALLAAWGRA